MPRIDDHQTQFLGLSPVMKELQRLIAFVAYDHVLECGSSLKSNQQFAAAEDLYHGKPSDPNSVGLVGQCLAGSGPFVSLFYTRKAGILALDLLVLVLLA